MSQSMLALSMARMFDHTGEVCLDVEVDPKMPRTMSKAISEDNGAIPQDESEFGGLTMEETYRVFSEDLTNVLIE